MKKLLSTIVILVIGRIPAYASWAVIQTTSATQNPATSVFSSTFPVNTTAGNLIVAFFNTSGSTITISNADIGGNAFTQVPGAKATSATTGLSDIWYLQNNPGGIKATTVHYAAATAFPAMIVYEVSGIKTSGSLDVAAQVSSQTATTTPLGAAVTTTAVGDFIVANVNVANSITGIHAGNEFTWDDSVKQFTAGSHITSASATAASHQPQWDESPSGAFCGSTASFFITPSFGLNKRSKLLKFE